MASGCALQLNSASLCSNPSSSILRPTDQRWSDRVLLRGAVSRIGSDLFLRNERRPCAGVQKLHDGLAVQAAAEVWEAEDVPPIPRSIHDISNGDHILGFGAQLTEDHPGFFDEEYKTRRSWIADLAKLHKIGEPILDIAYTEEETRVWRQVLEKLSVLYPTHACKEFLAAFQLFNFRPDRIPQLQELTEVLQQQTGWQIRPVAGLLHPRDFLNGLAFKTFHSTQYIRHGSNPMYTPEPDICHEILGHIPMLADPVYADLVHAIGVASLGASNMWHLTKLYWYTVEFGVIREGADVKAFGAGLLSSFGELQYLLAGHEGQFPEFQPLDPFKKLPKMSYKDGFQKTYFICDSFADTACKLRTYTNSLSSKP